MKPLRTLINRIGTQLVKDRFPYQDVVCDPKKGIIPRGLILEEDGRDPHACGAIVVGLNPGRTRPAQLRHNLEHGCTYRAYIEYWQKHLGWRYRYFVWTRRFLDAAGIGRPILWTELVHCESADSGKELSVETIRSCIDRHLVREIACLPEKWVLIGLGAEAYKILAYRFPKRLVISIPHPTGSYGQIHKLMPKGRLRPGAKHQLERILKRRKPVAAMFRCINGNYRFL